MIQGRVSRGSSDIPAGLVLIWSGPDCGPVQVLRRNLDPKEAECELEFVMTMLPRLWELLDPTAPPSTAQGQCQPGFFTQNIPKSSKVL